MAIRCGKRAESAFNSFKNDRQVLNAYLAHKAGYRPDLRRSLGCGARGRASLRRFAREVMPHFAPSKRAAE